MSVATQLNNYDIMEGMESIMNTCLHLCRNLIICNNARQAMEILLSPWRMIIA